MTDDDACKYPMPFGKFKGRTLEAIADDPDGPRYLDWVIGLELHEPFRDALHTFLSIPWVAEKVDAAVEDRERRDYSEPPENTRKPRDWWEKS